MYYENNCLCHLLLWDCFTYQLNNQQRQIRRFAWKIEWTRRVFNGSALCWDSSWTGWVDRSCSHMNTRKLIQQDFLIVPIVNCCSDITAKTGHCEHFLFAESETLKFSCIQWIMAGEMYFANFHPFVSVSAVCNYICRGKSRTVNAE